MYHTTNYTHLFAPDDRWIENGIFYTSYSYTKGITSIFEFFLFPHFYTKNLIESGGKISLYIVL